MTVRWEASSAWKTAAAAAVPALVAMVLYAPSAGGEFVWDDFALADGSGIGGGESLLACFHRPFLDHFFRPLVAVSFFFDRRWWPDNPTAYHWVNICLYSAACAIVALLVAACSRSRWTGLAGGLLFATHPTNVGAAAWIGGRTDVLAALWTSLCGLGLVAAARSLASRRSVWLAVAVVGYALAIFTKEQTLFLLPLVPLACICFRPERGVVLRGEPWYWLAPFIVATAFQLAMAVFLGMPLPTRPDIPLSEHLQRFGLAVAAYSELLIVPNQRPMHAMSLEPWADGGWGVAVLGWCIAAGALGLWIRWMHTDRTRAWLLAWVVLCILPVSNLFPLPFLLFAPYRAVVASVGLVGLLVITLTGSGAVLPRRGALVRMATLSTVVAWYTVQTMVGMPTWRSERNLFSMLLQYDPKAFIANYMYARLAMMSGDYCTAARHLETIMTNLFKDPGWDDPEQSWRMLRERRDVRARVRQSQGTTGSVEGFAGTLYEYLGSARMNCGDVLGAIRSYRTSLHWRPDSAAVHHGIGWCYAQLGDFAAAEAHLQEAVRLEPDAERHTLLAQILERRGKTLEALQHWRRAQELGAQRDGG